MSKKIMRIGRGYVNIEVEGDKLETFLNEALSQGVIFYDTQRLAGSFRAGVQADDFHKLRAAARVAQVEVHIRKKLGLPFVAFRWRRRGGLLLGVFLIFSAMVVLSQFVLTVSVSGNEKVPADHIRNKAQELGLVPWTPKSAMTYDRLEEELLAAIPDLSWVSIEERGTDILIKVVEKILPPTVLFQGDLVATKAGRVEQIMLIQGQTLVKEGDTVRSGQVLIQAQISVPEQNGDLLIEKGIFGGAGPTDAGGELLQVAKGFVRGRTWYSAEVEVALQETDIQTTGQQKNGWGIKVGERVIMITRAQSPYEDAIVEQKDHPLLSWRNWQLPVEIVKAIYQETEAVPVTRTPEEALALAKEKARQDVLAQIPPLAVTLRENVLERPASPGTVRVRAEVETFEDLAGYIQ